MGVRCTDGVVMAVEKLVVSKLLLPGTGKRIFTVDRHAGVAIAGLIPDGRQLASVARDECKQYTDLWGSPVPAKVLSGRVSTWAHAHTTLIWRASSTSGMMILPENHLSWKCRGCAPRAVGAHCCIPAEFQSAAETAAKAALEAEEEGAD